MKPRLTSRSEASVESVVSGNGDQAGVDDQCGERLHLVIKSSSYMFCCDGSVPVKTLWSKTVSLRVEALSHDRPLA